MSEFRAFRIHEADGGVKAGIESMNVESLTAGDVVIRTSYSDINYKDALAATGKGKILRKAPLNGGIDAAGKVVSSTDSRFNEGDAVLVCGGGLSETLDGGYAEYVRVPADIVVPMPAGLTEYDAMALGTAGFTAALGVLRMERMGQTPDHGPVLVTGATGGVGSLAIDMFASLGYEVVALTGKRSHADYLAGLGAAEVLPREEVEMGTRALEKARWGGAVDTVGGDTLAWLTRTVKPWGNIASIGMAGGVKLETTVMPFILRAVSLLGINSVEVPADIRTEAWRRLATDMRPRHLDRIVTRVVSFDDLPGVFPDFIEGRVTGRTVVRISG